MVSRTVGDARHSSKNCMNSSCPPKYEAPAQGGTPGLRLEGTLGGRYLWKVFGKVLSGSVAAVDHPPAGSPGGRDQPAHIAAAITVGDDGAAGIKARAAPAAVVAPATAMPATATTVPVCGGRGRCQRGTQRDRSDSGKRKFPQHGDLLKTAGAGLSRRCKGRRNGPPYHLASV